jgi:PBP1b-binding outer membrane lipoprotein LpoB
MKIRNQLLSILITTLLLTACSSDEKQDKKEQTKKPALLEHQMKALEDAKKIQAESKKKAEALKKEIDEQTGKSSSDD